MPPREVQSVSNDIVVSKTRPNNTTAYGAGDVLGSADTGTPANAGDAIWTFSGVPSRATLEGVSLRIDVDAIPSGMTTFRLHLYKSAPTAILDAATWDLPAGDRSAYLGYVDLPAVTDTGSTLFVQSDNINKRVQSTGDIMYGLLVTVGGFTPAASTVKTLTISVAAA